MNESTTTRERRRRRPIGAIATPAPGAPAPIPPAPPASHLNDLLEWLRDVARMKQYHIIGRLSRAQIYRPSGAQTIDFRKQGPVLAFANGTEQLIVTSEWEGLPAKWSDTETLCPDCQSTCDVCKGEGKKACEAFRCGGAGKVPEPTQACPDCVAIGPRKPDCSTCHGIGSITPMVECNVCAGSGKAPCSLCRGTGKRPTGIKDGDTDYRKPACATCRGSRFAHEEIPQPIEPFINVRLPGGIVALGPVTRFAIDSVGGTGAPPTVYDVSPDATGQYLALIIEPTGGAYLIGGILTAQGVR